MTPDDRFAPPPMPSGDSRGEAMPAAPSPVDPDVDPFAKPVPKRRRPGPILAAIVVLAVLGIGAGVTWDLVSSAQERAAAPAQRGDTGTFNGIQVVAGMCLLDPAAEERVGQVTVVDCSTPHHAEAVAAYAFPETAWPGSERVAREATDFCAIQVGRAFAATGLETGWRVWAPTQDTWAAGDRQALCVITSEEDLIGSYEAGDVARAPQESA